MSDVTLQEKANRTVPMDGDRFVLELFDEDTELEGFSRKVFAETVQLRVKEAIWDYRLDRSPRVPMT